MSNISRRDFMKTAGVMTLAVAASGVLASCSTSDAADNKVTEVTSNSVTVGDYTISITGTKRYSVKSYSKTDGSQDGDTQYLMFVYNVKKNKEDAKDPAFEIVPTDLKNITYSDMVTCSKTKDLFGLDMAANATFEASNFKNALATGTPYYHAFKLTTVKNNDGSFSVKTPSLNLSVMDMTTTKSEGTVTNIKVTLAKLPISVPSSAETKQASDLGIS